MDLTIVTRVESLMLAQIFSGREEFVAVGTLPFLGLVGAQMLLQILVLLEHFVAHRTRVVVVAIVGRFASIHSPFLTCSSCLMFYLLSTILPILTQRSSFMACIRSNRNLQPKLSP